MMISLLRNCSRLFFFGAALLIGIQVPGFVGEYRTRVDAHFREVSVNIAGFQQTADLLFDGSLDELVSYYRASQDRVFQSDAESIAVIVQRYRRFQIEQEIMQGNSLAAVWHVLSAADPELIAETRAQYTYTVPLDSLAIQWGVAMALLMVMLGELCLLGCIKCSRLVSDNKSDRLNQARSSKNLQSNKTEST